MFAKVSQVSEGRKLPNDGYFTEAPRSWKPVICLVFILQVAALSLQFKGRGALLFRQILSDHTAALPKLRPASSRQGLGRGLRGQRFQGWLELFSLRIQLKQSHLLLSAGFEGWLREMDRYSRLQQKRFLSQAVWTFLPKPHHSSSRLTGACLGFWSSLRLFSREDWFPVLDSYITVLNGFLNLIFLLQVQVVFIGFYLLIRSFLKLFIYFGLHWVFVAERRFSL